MRDKRKLNGFREGTKEKRDARGTPAKLLSRNTVGFFLIIDTFPFFLEDGFADARPAVAHAPWSTRWRCRRAPGGTRAGPRGISSEQTRRWCVSTRARRSLRARSVPSRGSTGIFFSARAGNAVDPARPRPPPSSRAKSAWGLRDTPRFGPDRPRLPPTAPSPAPRARRPASHAAPRSPYPPSSPDASARQETLAPSRASTDGPTPWSVTRGVVVGVAFGALVIAGGALVSTSSTEFGAEFGAEFGSVSPASGPPPGSRDPRARRGRRRVFAPRRSSATRERVAPRWRTSGAPRPARAAARCSAGTARARTPGARRRRARAARVRREAPNAPRGRHEKNEKNARLKTAPHGRPRGRPRGRRGAPGGHLAFAKPRPEDARERRARAGRAERWGRPKGRACCSNFAERRRRTSRPEEDALERASAACAERPPGVGRRTRRFRGSGGRGRTRRRRRRRDFG